MTFGFQLRATHATAATTVHGQPENTTAADVSPHRCGWGDFIRLSLLAILHIFRVRLRLRPMSKAKAVAMRLRLRIPPEAKDAAKALKALALRLRFRIPPKAKDAVFNGYTIDLHFEGSSARFKPQHLKSGFIPRP